jgi:hypothetical protein
VSDHPSSCTASDRQRGIQQAPEQVVHKNRGSTDETGRQDEHAEQAPPDVVPSRQLQVPRGFEA